MDKKIKIFQTGEKILRQKAKPVPVKEIGNEKFKKIIAKMEKIITENEEALAVAAPQVGAGWRIFVISEWALSPNSEKTKNEFKNMIFINPEIIKISKDKRNFPEGCLSVPQKYGSVSRAEKIKIEAYNQQGKKFSRGASGLLAQTIQHEIDHLNGVLFIDKTTQKPG